ncbi:ABC transporter permease [Akkermansia sp. N21169]|mgnify:CR=1 FL=1|jgi:ABC-2 type transport system permease protein|uniref:ABC transporter permease n=1 Tax=unclassified Akkermansia TaxID=2608915 RepID=UPI00244E7390|nr:MULTISPECIES: ABC transporter permease [unclassified Akkermansia]MDH3067713.1 ABC transporter permease [Akkermansia sp. N21169]WPX41656.1 ABC transporter permease [Akkermansia sp. N21116]
MIASLRRIVALVVKELHQIARDPGNIAIAVVLPAVLLILFGYGLSMDVNNIRVAWYAPVSSDLSRTLESRMTLSPYFHVTKTFSSQEAEEALRLHRVDAIVSMRSDTQADLVNNHTASVQIIVNGSNANQAKLMNNYLRSVVSSWAVSELGVAPGSIAIEPRMRYNEAVDSHYYLVPGVIVIIMTMIGSLLTALVMAREYERGTLEGLFSTPVHSWEILIAKGLTNFLLGMVSFAISMLFAAYVFHIPIRGSLPVLIGVSALYLVVALGLGLVISTTTKNQFLSCQLAILGTFLPALMLSGFVYDILNMPLAVQAITWVIPAKYYMTMMVSLFLAGDIPILVYRGCIALVVFSLVLWLTARLKSPKSLE